MLKESATGMNNIPPDDASETSEKSCEATEEFDLKRIAFFTTRRTEENFARDNTDEKLILPCPYNSEYTPGVFRTQVLPVTGFFPRGINESGLGSRLFVSVWVGSLGLGFACSAVSSILWIFLSYERYCNPESDMIQQWLESVGGSFNVIRGDYDFYPIFLIVGYLGFVVQRWRAFMVNCHTVQANLHGVALLCGGSTIGTPSMEIRKQLFKIYRYLNLIHALCYKKISPTIGALDIKIDFVNTLGLLTPTEAQVLLVADNKMRDTVVTWLSIGCSELMRMDGIDRDFATLQLSRAVRDVRDITENHHDLFVRDNPNLYLQLMYLVVNGILILAICGYPFSLLVKTPSSFPGLPCVQPVVLIGVFVVTASFRTAYSLLARLRNPFSWTRDRIKVDSLLASTDRTVFAILRASFVPTNDGAIDDVNAIENLTRLEERSGLASLDSNATVEDTAKVQRIQSVRRMTGAGISGGGFESRIFSPNDRSEVLFSLEEVREY